MIVRSRPVKEEEEEVDETKCRVRKKSKFELLKEEETKSNYKNFNYLTLYSPNFVLANFGMKIY